MAEYILLLNQNEAEWYAADDARRAEVYEAHGTFNQLLAQRGHTVVSAAELTHSQTGHIVAGALDDVQVTQGPYAESVEQVSGYYHIRTDDLDDLLKLSGALAAVHPVEVRPTVDHSQDAS